MARARNIKPSIFKNEVLGVADPLYTLLFEGLWVLADRRGRLEDRPLRIKAEILPYRENIKIEEMLAWLQSNGFIVRYETGGQKVIQINNFEKHQNPHKNEPESTLPPKDAETAQITAEQGATSEKIGSTHADSLNLIPDSLNLIPSTAASATKADYPPEFELTWREYPDRPGASKKDAFKAWSARIKAGVDVAVILAGVQRYAGYCEASKTEPQFIKQPATFFGPGEHYLADWKAPASRPSSPPRVYHDLKGMDYTKGVDSDGRF